MPRRKRGKKNNCEIATACAGKVWVVVFMSVFTGICLATIRAMIGCLDCAPVALLFVLPICDQFACMPYTVGADGNPPLD